MSGWTVRAEARVKELERDVDRLAHQDDGPNLDWQGQVRTEIGEVGSALNDGLWRARRRLDGMGPAWAWTRLHAIEEEIYDKDHDHEVLRRATHDHLHDMPASSRDTVDAQLEKLLGKDPERFHTKAMTLIQETHRQDAQIHDSEHSHQRGTVIVSAVLLLGAVLLLLLQWAVIDTSLIALATESTAANTDPGVGGTTLLALVMMFGAAGALMSALTSLYGSASRLQDTTWFDPRPGLTIAKVAAGVWASVLGIYAVNSGVLVGDVKSLQALLFVSVVFGYSQQLLTQALDRRSEKLVDSGSKMKQS